MRGPLRGRGASSPEGELRASENVDSGRRAPNCKRTAAPQPDELGKGGTSILSPELPERDRTARSPGFRPRRAAGSWKSLPFLPRSLPPCACRKATLRTAQGAPFLRLHGAHGPRPDRLESPKKFLGSSNRDLRARPAPSRSSGPGSPNSPCARLSSPRNMTFKPPILDSAGLSRTVAPSRLPEIRSAAQSFPSSESFNAKRRPRASRPEPPNAKQKGRSARPKCGWNFHDFGSDFARLSRAFSCR